MTKLLPALLIPAGIVLVFLNEFGVFGEPPSSLMTGLCFAPAGAGIGLVMQGRQRAGDRKTE